MADASSTASKPAPPDESELDRRGRLARVGKGYALRMTDNGRKPWIGGSTITRPTSLAKDRP